MISEKVLELLPQKVREKVEPYTEAVQILSEVKNPRVLASLAPAGVRGMILQQGKQGKPTLMKASHSAYFDWEYPQDQEEMRKLYERAKVSQWNAATDIPWETDVDPLSTDVPIIPKNFLGFDTLHEFGVHLTEPEVRRAQADTVTWMLSQFLHGEQGALMAAAQVTEAVEFFDGKLYGATQVMDEARHVEVFHRYLDQKLNKVYQVNDNLFVIIDALMTDSRWDMKFLGMQIMVEGLALGAFGVLYKMSKEPLLREVLKKVIQDEARHVHYGVLALREHFNKHISDAERREREDWAFEVALLMRNRFMAYEIYEESFEGIITRKQWRKVVLNSPGLELFRHTMFRRLVPNLRAIGLMSDRIIPHYERVGLMKYFGGKAADMLDEQQLLEDLDMGSYQAEAAE